MIKYTAVWFAFYIKKTGKTQAISKKM